MSDALLWLLSIISKWVIIPLILFGLVSAISYFFTEPKQNKQWAIEHALLPNILITGNKKNPEITLKNVRDFNWITTNDKKVHYQETQFQLKDIKGLKAVVSHFSVISEIAHVYIIFTLNDGREFAVSIEARREQDEGFSLHGGLFAKFEIIYVLATPKDLLDIRKKNNESVHIYPIKVTTEKSQELFLLIAQNINALTQKPALYHLFFKNCTNQLVKHVSILTEEKYPWYFQTIAPGKTGKLLFDLGLIDLPDTSFDSIQTKTLIKQ